MSEAHWGHCALTGRVVPPGNVLCPQVRPMDHFGEKEFASDDYYSDVAV